MILPTTDSEDTTKEMTWPYKEGPKTIFYYILPTADSEDTTKEMKWPYKEGPKTTRELIFINCGLFVLLLVVFVLFLLSLRFSQISPLAFFRWFTVTSDREINKN